MRPFPGVCRLFSMDEGLHTEFPRVRLARLPTPVEPLSRFFRGSSLPRVFVKRDDATGTEFSGNKVRKLEFVLGRALREGADTLVTCGGIQSNHARATAAVAARLGLGCHLVLRGTPPADSSGLEGNLLLDALLGATFRWITPAQWPRVGEILAEEGARLRERGLQPWLIPEGASDGTGALGYREAVREIRDFQEREGVRVEVVVHAMGSGGTAAGLLLGREAFGLSFRLVSVPVCDDAAWFRKRVDSILGEAAELHGLAPPSLEGWEIPEGFQGDGYALSTPEEMDFYARVAGSEGLVLDPVYTGKAFRALDALAREGTLAGPGETVLFLHTGGLFGLFSGSHGPKLPLPWDSGPGSMK